MYLHGKTKMARLFALLFVAAVLLSGCVSPHGNGAAQTVTAAILDDAVVQGTLTNGMSYYIRKNAEPRNRIFLRLVVRAGSNMEADDQKGVAHFVEHLAFNGTEHFAKNSLVSYLQSIGMNFGADVNAWTSFDETVYMLEVPADDADMLKNALLILHDWASSVSFEQEELDKERGVVTEEWRIGQGLQRRIQDVTLPLFYANSRYAEREPIGDMDIIHNVSRERVVDFYKTWYRPEFMSVIAVGDIDTTVLEKAIIAAMEQIPASDGSVQHPAYGAPEWSKKNAVVIQDAEQQEITLALYAKKAHEPALSDKTRAQKLARNVASAILNERLSALTLTAQSPWRGTAFSSFELTSTTDTSYLYAAPKSGHIEDSLKLLLDEYDRIVRFGVTQDELARQKTQLLTDAEQRYKNRESIDSDAYASAILNSLLRGDVLRSEEDYYTWTKAAVEALSVADVNREAKALLPDRGSMLQLLAPASETVPTEEALKALWTGWKNKQIAAYKDVSAAASFGERPKKKAAVASSVHIDGIDANEYVLENGVRIVTKQTDFEKDIVYAIATSEGGRSLLPDADIPSSQIAAQYASYSGICGMSASEVQKALAGSGIDRLRVRLSGDWEGFSAAFAGKGTETVLQLFRAYFAEPQFTDDGWSTIAAHVEQSAKQHGSTPQDALWDAVLSLRYGDSLRFSPLTPEYAAKMDRASAERIYRERFKNAADFTFVFVGDFDEAGLLELCQYYIGTLPGEPGVREHAVRVEPPFPSGKPSVVVQKGSDKQSTVYLAFGGMLPAAKDARTQWKDDELFSSFTSLLEMKLFDKLREDKSGTYGVTVDGGIDTLSLEEGRTFEVELAFGCEPGREQELIDEALAEIRRLQSAPLDAETLTKLQEAYRRDKETALRTNGWWTSWLETACIYGFFPQDSAFDVETIPAAITADSMQALVARYCNTENYITAVLEPESK